MSLYHTLLQNLGLRQQAYQMGFGRTGSAGHRALVDLAEFCGAFNDDTMRTHDDLLIMQGRRQAFFRIFKNVKLSPAEMEIVCKDTIVHTAARLQQARGVENE
jgi:hypothetical protein